MHHREVPVRVRVRHRLGLVLGNVHVNSSIKILV